MSRLSIITCLPLTAFLFVPSQVRDLVGPTLIGHDVAATPEDEEKVTGSLRTTDIRISSGASSVHKSVCIARTLRCWPEPYSWCGQVVLGRMWKEVLETQGADDMISLSASQDGACPVLHPKTMNHATCRMPAQ